MAAAGLAKLGICLIILVQFLIENSDSQCSNIDFEKFSPCDYETVLITSQGPCNVLIPDLTHANNAPTVKLESAEESKKYLLLVLDPDAPNPASHYYRFWIHWIVHSIKGSSLKNGVIDGTTILDYAAPSPPSGVHRYQFFVFEQPSTFRPDGIFPSSDDDRGYFNLNLFASTTNLCNNLKGSYQYHATRDYTLTGAVIMVSDGMRTMLPGAPTPTPTTTTTTVPTDSGGGGPDAPAAPKDSATVKPAGKTTKNRKGSGLQSIFPSRVEKIRFFLISFCATYAFKPSC